MKKEPNILPSVPADPAEALLHTLIAECHAIIRDDVIPSSRLATEAYERCRFYQSAVDLVAIATGGIDAIARLRGGGAATEMRQRITVERVQPLITNPHGDKGEG